MTRATGAATSAWRAPVADLRVVAPFDAPARPWLAGHRGVDLDAPVGTPVLAPRAGVVTYAGWVVDRPVLTVRHDDGLRSSVEPVDALVEVGARVVAGGVVGLVAEGRTHCTPTCVHWGVRDGDVYLDPMLLLRGATVVLLARRGGPGRRVGVSRGPPR
ncbi:M23 family metallopeptidase [Cellulomonas triticagri]|uniref:M23 family metallopeptidase n=1 Tax=Cellulomonas triticagri TaxID=2483352 RepID=UPI0013152DBC|nr:peptidoglycan DD-metalloendopeptidase family protein [Cellulomonas triticagri]